MPKARTILYSKTLPTKQEEAIVKTPWKGVVLGAVLINEGSGYVNSTNLPTIGGSGSQTGQFNCKVDITTTAGAVTGITINSGGIGYSLNDVLVVNVGEKNCTFRANPVST